MSIFSTILEKLGLKKEDKPQAVTPAPAAPKPASATVTTGAPASSAAKPVVPAHSQMDSRPVPQGIKDVKPVGTTVNAQSMAPAAMPTPPAPAAPVVKPMEMVDVVGKLEKMAKDAGGGLDWKASIVDLLKLLHIDSSLEARKELAVELGCPADLMKESRNMNIWLHKTVLQKLAENGGNIPKELLD
jgi:hypothetical protein